TYSHQHRQQWVQGVVNDANAQAFGGISTHAGLFGRIEDVSLWLLEMRHSLCSTHGFLASSTVKKFMQRSMPKECGDWSLGFMLPSYDGSSGKYFSKKSVGHLGFTGTSFWWDSVKDVFIVILANRYVGQKEGEHFKLLRPKIHNLVMESLHI
ncbi:MAG: serine hydrolase, partial [Bdellovibrionales bacterium]|nr:serine hydrolase [Bdellovibrionales bacterium]